MSLADVKSAVEALSEQEFTELESFVRQREWDRRINADFSETGRFHAVLERVRADFWAGQVIPVLGRTHRRFWKYLGALPPTVQELARKMHVIRMREPLNPWPKFKEHGNGVCVLRIGKGYRSLGLKESEMVVWFWIGTQEEYNSIQF